MKTIRIPQGNEFSLFVPLVLKDGTAVEGESLSDIQVLLQSAPPRQSYAVSVNVQSNYVVITPQVELPLGSYDLTITARYENRDIAILLNNCFAISTWTNGSDYEKYLVSNEMVLEQQVLIGAFNTDAELETLKEQYREAIAATETARLQYEAAKEAFNEKAEQLEDVAQETTSQEIKQDVADVKTAVENIDFSELAKQGTNADATNTAILEAAENAATDAAAAKVAAQDTAALNSEVLAGKQAIVDAINTIGGSSSATKSLGQIADDITQIPLPMDNIEYVDDIATPIDLPNIIAHHGNGIKKILNSSATSIQLYAFQGNNTLEDANFQNVTSVGANSFYQMTKIKCIDLPNCIAIGQSSFSGIGSMCKILLPRVTSTNVPQPFRSSSGIYQLDLSSVSNFGNTFTFLDCTNLIDLITGAAIRGSILFTYGYAAYYPTNAMNANSSSLCFETDELEYGRTFANNFEKWKWCIINHFAANLQDRTGMNAYTLTFSSGVLNKFDAEMTAAFTSKNWTLAAG